MLTALWIIVVIAVLAWAASNQMRQQRRRDQTDDALAAAAATGAPDALRQLADRLTLGRPGDCQRVAAAARRHLTNRMAPACATGLAKGAKQVAEACATMLGEIGAPGLRAAWSAYLAGAPEPGQGRLRAFLLRNPDWLSQELFHEWADAHGEGEPPHADLWRSTGLQQRLIALRDMGDPHVAPLAESLLERLGVGQATSPKP